MQQPRFMISGGGTGGHIFPAIAIADGLKEKFPEAGFLFVGAKNRMEMERVPAAGYPIEGIWISGISRKLSSDNLSFPFKLISSLWRCRNLLKRFKPDVVIGTGGFASGPLLYAATMTGTPTLIQEQNSHAGITNRLLGGRVNKICVAYEGMEKFFPAEKLVFTGNPIRNTILKGITERNAANNALGLNPERKTLLVLGGSLGARKINELVAELWPQIKSKNINLMWQCGKLYYDGLEKRFKKEENEQFRIHPFLSNMNDVLGAADVVISRAGAGTISELAVAGKATILIPSPNVAEDHQTRNAEAMTNKDAALIFRESEDPKKLLNLVEELLDDGRRSEMANNIRRQAKPNATADIIQEIEKLLNR